jgi:PAT family beta-lactamase induction signal transducer AmpG
MTSLRIPALSESAFLRYFSFSDLYVAQGLPFGLIHFGLPAWMAINGIEAAEIGVFVAIIGIPWSLKILAAPLMDRFTFLVMGRRRPWIIFGQTGLVAGFIFMAFIPDPLQNITLLAIAGFMINNYSFVTAMILFTLVILIIMFIPLILRERPQEKIMPWSKGRVAGENEKIQLHSWRAILRSLYQVFFLPVSLLMGIAAFSFSVGRGLIDTLLPVFTVQELGWSDSDYSGIFAYYIWKHSP